MHIHGITPLTLTSFSSFPTSFPLNVSPDVFLHDIPDYLLQQPILDFRIRRARSGMASFYDVLLRWTIQHELCLFNDDELLRVHAAGEIVRKQRG